MSLLELPHTSGCVVCGAANPHGLQLDLLVDDATGVVETNFTPAAHHIGFEGIVHGGVLATVIDEAMVWAATWGGKRFCVCGELTTRYRQSAAVGEPLRVFARVISRRSRFIETTCDVVANGVVIATGAGKYVPLSEDRHAAFLRTFVEDTDTAQAAAMLNDLLRPPG